MATSEEIEKYCRNCVSRDFVNGKGLVCKRTGELPVFEEECDSFEQDKELERLAPPKPEDFPVSMTEEEMLAEENLPKGILCAVVMHRWCGGMGFDLRFYRSSDRIYAHCYRIHGRFCDAAGQGNTSHFRNYRCGIISG